MNRTNPSRLLALCLAFGLSALAARPAAALTVYLRAEATTKTMPDGTVVPMWGFARDTSFGAHNGTVSVPGPQIDVPAGDSSLVIVVENNLPEPVSIAVPGATLLTAPNPARYPNGRVRSFLFETAPGNGSAVTYRYRVNPGSYIYHSASHATVQVQMGLYGAVVRDFTQNVRAYSGTATFSKEATVFLSEIDPALHDAVAGGDFGPGLGMVTTMDYNPRYFLVNGESFTTTAGFDPYVYIAGAGSRSLVRFFNAGLRTRTPTILGLRMTVIGEDAQRVTNARDVATLFLPAMKTADVLVQPTGGGSYPLYDRSLGLTNGMATGGGMLRYLVAGVVAPAPLPAAPRVGAAGRAR